MITVATIKTPVEGFTGTVVGVDFKDGVGETDSVPALEYFERQGYSFEIPDAPTPKGTPSKSWKVDELKAFAETHGLDLGDAKTKDEILEALAPAQTDPPSPIGPDGLPVLSVPAE